MSRYRGAKWAGSVEITWIASGRERCHEGPDEQRKLRRQMEAVHTYHGFTAHFVGTFEIACGMLVLTACPPGSQASRS